jgi:hypothetical protein
MKKTRDTEIDTPPDADPEDPEREGHDISYEFPGDLRPNHDSENDDLGERETGVEEPEDAAL